MSEDTPTPPAELIITTLGVSHTQHLNELLGALAEAQGEMLTADLSANNPHFKKAYADLSDIWAACRPALSKHGLSVIQLPYLASDGKAPGLCSMLGHKSGQWIMTKIEVVGAVNQPQAVGSILTYLRRYTLGPMVGVAVRGEDDDGESGEGRGRNNDRNDSPPPRNAAPPQTRQASRPTNQDSGPPAQARPQNTASTGAPAQAATPPPIPEAAKQWVDRFNAETDVERAKKLREDTRTMFEENSAENKAVRHAWGQCARRLGITAPKAATPAPTQGQGS